MNMRISKIAIVGTGYMGVSLTLVIAKAGYSVILKSRTSESLEFALKKIETNLKRELENNKISKKEFNEVFGHLSGTTDFVNLSNSDLVIEAIIENFKAKGKLFKELDMVCAAHTIFASNTSSLSITELAKSCKRPDKFIGLHFFNPPAKMKLVEVVKGNMTSNQSINNAIDFASSIGKKPILVNDSPGFIVNRLLFPMINEAINALMEGVACKEDIDASMRLGANHPMGPLELADLIGLVEVALNRADDGHFHARRPPGAHGDERLGCAHGEVRGQPERWQRR